MYNFIATADDNSTYSDTESFDLEVLERRTLLRNAPPSAVALPGNHELNFVVSASGGAPSTEHLPDPTPPPDCLPDSLDAQNTARYTYYWTVTPVDSNTPQLGTPTGTAPVPECGMPGPQLISITFEDSGGAAVTGTYDITFWAQDYLRRQNPSDPDYQFVPATTRIKIISPAGRTLEKDASRPTLLRQEQFR
jgi:hypothetical protein